MQSHMLSRTGLDTPAHLREGDQPGEGREMSVRSNNTAAAE